MLGSSAFLSAYVHTNAGGDLSPFAGVMIITVAIGGFLIYELFKRRK
jgi:hypothetical protein